MNKKTIIVLAVILIIGLVVGAIYLFKKSGTGNVAQNTTTSTTKSGLSSLLGNLNLSGLDLSMFGG